MRAHALLALLVATTVSLSACILRRFHADSQTQHTRDDPLPESSDNFWHNLPPEQFDAAVRDVLREILALSFGHQPEMVEKVKFAPANDLTTQRLQAIVDRLDGSLRLHIREIDGRTGGRLLERLAQIPPPRALVQIRSQPNAMAVGAEIDGARKVFPAIVFHAGLLREAQSEADVVAVLAHEMGHYYKADPALLMVRDPGFFFRMSETPVGERPRPDPSMQALGDRVIAASRQGVHPLLPGQELHIGLAWGPLAQADTVIAVYCGRTSCQPQCQQFLQTAQTRFQIFNEDNYGRTDPAFVEMVRPYESAFLACAQTLPLANIGHQEFLNLLNPESRRFVSPPYGETLQEFFKVLSRAAATAEIENTKPVLLEAVKQRLGYYTYEEEADDMGLEIASVSGFDPRILFDYRMERLRRTGPFWRDEEIEFGYEKCLDSYRRGWKDENGHAIFVPVGDFNEIHHSSCYRAFNLDRELRAHQYPQPANPPLFPGPAFAEVKAAAEALLRQHPTL